MQDNFHYTRACGSCPNIPYKSHATRYSQRATGYPAVGFDFPHRPALPSKTLVREESVCSGPITLEDGIPEKRKDVRLPKRMFTMKYDELYLEDPTSVVSCGSPIQ